MSDIIKFTDDAVSTDINNQIFYGIDLGTTYTVVSAIDSSDIQIPVDKLPVKLLSVEQHSPFELDGSEKSEMVASVLGVDKYNRMYVGNKLYRLKGHPLFKKDKNLFYHWKLDLGVSVKPLYKSAVREDVDDAVKVAGKILNYIRLQTIGKQTWKNVVVTVPASFQSNQRIDVLHAMKYGSIDIDTCSILDEPNAAIIGYLNQISNQEKFEMLHTGQKNFLVIDFGGGTCDLSLIKIKLENNSFLNISNLSISRYNDLGGQDIDMLIAEKLLLPEFQKQVSNKEFENEELETLVLPQLAVLAERIKIELSQLIAAKYSSYSKINLPNLNDLTVSYPEFEMNINDEFLLKDIKITGQDLYDIMLHLFSSTSHRLEIIDKVISSVPSVIDDTLDKANFKRTNIDYVLYVGGSVQNLLFIHECQQLLSSSVCLLPQRPDTLVAKGASIYSFYKNRYKIELIKPIVSDTIGIITKNAKFYPLVKAGTVLPFEFEFDNFNLQGMHQRRVEIPICIENSDCIVHVISFNLNSLNDINETIKIKVLLDKDKLFKVSVHIGVNQLAEIELINPIALANISSENRQILLTKHELDNARLNNNLRDEMQLLRRLIKEYYGISSYNRCISSCLEFLNQFDPIDDGVLNYLYCSYNALGQKRKASETIRKAVKHHPNKDYLNYNLSLTIESEEGPQKAIEFIENLSDKNKSDLDIRLRYSLLKLKVGDNREAKQVIEDYKNKKIYASQTITVNLIKKIFSSLDEPWLEAEKNNKEKPKNKAYASESLLRVNDSVPEKI